MITAPEPNVKLSGELLSPIEEAHLRLSTLQGEIAIATKNLTVINKDIAKSIKERKYQESLLENVNTEISLRTKVKNDLESTISFLEGNSKRLHEECDSINTEIANKKQSLDGRETLLIVGEEILKQSKISLEIATNEYAEKIKVLDKVYDAFSTALATITWR